MIEWSDEEFGIGIQKIDEQHRQLIALANSLSSMPAEADLEQMKRSFHTVRFYLSSHFSDEERIMRRMGFPGLEAHQREHLECLRRVAELEAEFQAKGPSAELQGRLAGFFSVWFLQHTSVEDKKYSRFLLD